VTKREMAEAMMLHGKTLYNSVGDKAWWSNDGGFNRKRSDSVFVLSMTGDAWDDDWEIKPEPLFMTRDEVLGFLAHTPGIVVRYKGSTKWAPSGMLGFHNDIRDYEYATVDLDGNYGEPQEFRR